MIWWQGLAELQPFFSEQAEANVFSWDCSQWRPIRSPEQVTPVALLQDQGL